MTSFLTALLNPTLYLNQIGLFTKPSPISATSPISKVTVFVDKRPKKSLLTCKEIEKKNAINCEKMIKSLANYGKLVGYFRKY